MCGIAGIIDISAKSFPLESAIERMTDSLRHRGPDQGNSWFDSNHGLALGHRRLAVVDLTEAGTQPMTSRSERYVMVFNGEIYNHLDLRLSASEKFPETRWRGTSDSETLLECIALWGVADTLEKCVGMFAFALWDKETLTLTLMRDRFGEKPLYYGVVEGIFVFASELKAFHAISSSSLTIDENALGLYLQYGYVPEPFSILAGVSKLEPGCLIRVTLEQLRAVGVPDSLPYWSAVEVAREGEQNQLDTHDHRDHSDSLESLLVQSVKQQMVADVPIGAFLSGGVDSSTVVGMMQANSTSIVKTYSIGFEEAEYDEANFAKDVAKHLGTDHTELYVTNQELLDVVPKIPLIWDEPFSDSSQIPTFLVSELARRDVTVALTGDGGDELFGGYTRYGFTQQVWEKAQNVPRPMRSLVAHAVTSLSPRAWDGLSKPLMSLLPPRFRFAKWGNKAHLAARMLSKDTDLDAYLALVQMQSSLQLLGRAPEPNPLRQKWPKSENLVENMMVLDAITYMTGDILAKVDRAAMAVSLETRAPFLDHRVYEFSRRLPTDLKVNKGEGKWLLKQVLDRYVPRHLVDRPKMGFGVPLGTWLKGPLRQWAEERLDPELAEASGISGSETVSKMWSEHLSGSRDWATQIWTIVCFIEWNNTSKSHSCEH